MKKIILFIVSLMLVLSSVHAQKKSEVDHISLAALLIKDAHYDRALKSLKEVDLANKETDFKRFYTLRALAYMYTNDFKEAVDDFKAAQKAGLGDSIINIYLAQSYFKLEAYTLAIASFEKAPKLLLAKPQYLAIHAECHWKLKNKELSI